MRNPVGDDTPSPEYQLPPIDTWFDDVVPHLHGYFIVRVGGRVHFAEDLTQETLLAAVTSRTGPSPETPILAWLYGIARHKLLDHYRRAERDRLQFGTPLEPDIIDIGPSPPLAQLDLDDAPTRDAIIRVLDELTPRQRAALVIRYFDDCDVATTARLLDLSIHATESLLARARRAFRCHYLEHAGDDA
jgi:RNA polymerase sigma-70 factor (ECF subfamily)